MASPWKLIETSLKLAAILLATTHLQPLPILATSSLATSMAHPLIPQITDIANPIAAELGLEVVAVAFHTHERPPSLRIDIRNPIEDTGLQDCERMSRALEAALDATEVIPFEYALEVSSPGTSRELTTDREFNAFSGFTVQVTAKDAVDGKPKWQGNLVRRDETTIYLNKKGRMIEIPRELVDKVSLDDLNAVN